MKKQIIKIAIPAAIHNLIDTLQLLVDIFMVGKLSPAAVAAVGLSGQFIILIYSFISVFYVGTNAIASRYYGAKDLENFKRVSFNAGVFALVSSLPITFFTLIWDTQFFQIMGTSQKVQILGKEYLDILSFSIPALFIGAVLYSTLAASGDTKTPLKIAIFSNIINVVLNYCLIFGNCGFPALEVKGAALASTISYILEVLIYLLVVLKRNYIKIEFSKEINKKVLKIGIPAGIEKFISFGSFLVFVKIIAAYGTAVLAGYQIGLRIESIAFMPGIGFSTAAMVLVGQYIGAQKIHLAEKSATETLKIAATFMGFVGILMVIFAEDLMKIFTSDKDTIQYGAIYLKIVGVSQVPLALDFVLNGALKGAGATKLLMIFNNLSFWLFRIIPAFIAYEAGFGIKIIYLIMIGETFIKGFLLWIIFKKGNWKEIKI
ncbi:MATE family efflux transporter [Persephonella sp. KM09-Lau-8]|uniref:MATE family efflux transporter n=1 Tax=Persephonella sp. KM09-Lau-8 TaxID=1158345 RepID=UPI00055BBBB8|nr:MATE family efflux transporter [Persephonella sp. KM09-Lau-8]